MANFKKAAELGPKNVNAQLALGMFYQSRNRIPEAEQQFKHAIEVDPKDPEARAHLAVQPADGGKARKPEAEAYLIREPRTTSRTIPRATACWAISISPTTNSTRPPAGHTSRCYRDHPRRDIQVKKNYVQLLILKNRLDEATKLNDEILKAAPRDAEALVYRGQIQLRQSDARGAVDTLQQAIKNDSNNAVAHYQLGLAYDMQHNEAQAESELREAVEKLASPIYVDAQRALAPISSFAAATSMLSRKPPSSRLSATPPTLRMATCCAPWLR